MRYLICPDSFKGSLTAAEAAEAMRQGVAEADPEAEVIVMPMADGGEGTAGILASALGGCRIRCEVCSADRRKIEASYYMENGTTAVMDAASAVGLSMLPPERRDIMTATSAGVGELIMDARRHGATEILLGVGGTSTCDGGRGIYEVLTDRGFSDCAVTVLCDVDNPLYGPEGAAYVFAPQKGASAAQVRILDDRLREWNRRMISLGGLDVSGMPGAGAAGGIAGMLASLFGARLAVGADYIARAIGLPQAMGRVDAVLTGEGRIDAQTLHGKVLSRVMDLANRFGVPVQAYAGCVEPHPELDGLFSSLNVITPAGMTLFKAMERDTAFANLRHCSYLCNSKRIGNGHDN